jgi:site-specific DNA-methyltransferase (adenine-specific)
MIVEQKALTDIKPYIKNPRKKWDIQKVAQSIKEFGFQQPIVVDSGGTIIVGHGRYEAAKLLKLNSIPVTIADLPPEKAKAYRIADNKTNEFSEWDISLLQQEFTDLLDANFDLELTGFDHDELESLITGEKAGLTDDDAVPELLDEPKSKLGDIYKLGEHRLMCGDSSIINHVEKLLDGTRPDMVFTDPPYNIDYQGVKDKKDKIKNDKMNDDDFVNFLTNTLYSCETMYVCCSWQYSHLFKKAMELIGRKPKAMIVWDKVNPAQHLDKYFKQHELIYYYGDYGGQNTLRGDVWKLKRQKNTVHPTMKPVELISIALSDQSKNKKVLDIFGGSGSTLIACEKKNRICFMMEYEPKYIDVIIKRWEDYTGKKAELLNG